MGEKSILAEAADALCTADRIDDRKCPHRLLSIFDPEGCKECDAEARALAAIVLVAAENRFRAIAQRFRDAEAEQSTLGAQWSAAEQARRWDEVADMLAKGLSGA